MATDVLTTQFVNALRLSLSPTTAAVDRQAATTFIQQLKEDAAFLPVISVVLMSGGDEQQSISLLTLTILSDWVQLWWNKVSESDQMGVRNLTCDLFSGPMGLSSSTAIRSKISVILAGICERQFPQCWPTLVEDLIKIWTESPFERQDIVLKTLEYLSMDCIDSGFSSSLPTTRRAEIIAGLLAKQELLLHQAYNFLRMCLNNYSNNFGNEEGHRAQIMVSAVCNFLIPLSAFMKIDDMCCSANSRDFSLLLVQCISIPHVQLKAIEVLQSILSHKMSYELFVRLVAVLSTNPCNKLPEDDDQSLSFQRVYGITLHSMLAKNTAHLLSHDFNRDPSNKANIGAYFTIMAQLLRQPYRRLSGDVIKDWSKILKEESSSSIPELAEMGMVVLQDLITKLKRPSCLPSPTDPASYKHTAISAEEEREEENFDLEFDDLEDWMDFFETYRQGANLFISCVVTRFPLRATEVLCNYAMQMVGGAHGISVGGVGGQEERPFLLAFEAFEKLFGTALLAITTLLDQAACTSCSSSSSFSSSSSGMTPTIDAQTVEQIKHRFFAILQSLLTWRPSRPAFKNEQLRYVGLFSTINHPLLRYSDEFIASTLQFLFETAATPDPIINSKNARSGGKESMRAADLIASLCDKCAVTIVASPNLLSGLLNQARTVLLDSNNIHIQSSMRETLVCMSESMVLHLGNNASVAATRGNILDCALNDLLEKWSNSPDVSASAAIVFSSPGSLLQAVGLDLSAAEPVNPINTSTQVYLELKIILMTVTNIARRVVGPTLPVCLWSTLPDASSGRLFTYSLQDLGSIFPFANAWCQFIPHIFLATCSLHGLWQPDCRKEVAQRCDSADGNRLFASALTCSKDTTSTHKTSKTLSRIAGELKEFRVHLYHALGLCATHRTLYVLDGFGDFLTSLCQALPNMENNHFSLLCKHFIEPLILSALPCHFPQLIPMLAVLFSSTLIRINVAWTGGYTSSVIYASCSLYVGYEGITSEQELDTMRDNTIREMTRSYADLLSSLFCTRGELSVPVPSSSFIMPASSSASAALNASQSKGVDENGTNDKQKQEAELKTAKRAALFMLWSPDSDASLTMALCVTICTLIATHDSKVSYKGIQCAYVLLERCAVDSRFHEVVGRDCFTAVLRLLIEGEQSEEAQRWMVGNEWAYVEFLMDVYIVFVLGERQTTKGTTAPQGMKAIPLSDVPRKILVDLGVLTTVAKIKFLEGQLQIAKNLKKRRMFFKDFITDVGRALKRSSGLETADSGKGVADLKIKSKLKPNKKKGTAPTLGVGLSSLFDDDDL